MANIITTTTQSDACCSEDIAFQRERWHRSEGMVDNSSKLAEVDLLAFREECHVRVHMIWDIIFRDFYIHSTQCMIISSC